MNFLDIFTSPPSTFIRQVWEQDRRICSLILGLKVTYHFKRGNNLMRIFLIFFISNLLSILLSIVSTILCSCYYFQDTKGSMGGLYFEFLFKILYFKTPMINDSHQALRLRVFPLVLEMQVLELQETTKKQK